ncbi:hypothetical protein [Alkalibacillus silvisoli]
MSVMICLLVLHMPITLLAFQNETYNFVESYEYFEAGELWSTDAIRVEVVESVYSYEAELYSSGELVESMNADVQQNYWGINCNGYWYIDWYDESGNYLGSDEIEVYEIQDQASACENSHQQGDGGMDSGGDICTCFFESPHWQDYVGQIDDIIGTIPEPPNWNRVADTFYDRVVPQLVSDFEQMLGTAPSAPTLPTVEEPNPIEQPEQPTSNLDDRNISDSEPTFESPSEMEDASFDEDDLMNEAEEIEFREDESEGFEISDPVDSLPELPDDDLPIPGETDPGDYGDHQPEQEEVEFPESPSNDDAGDPIPDEPPAPDEGEEEAPTPGDEPSDAPVPGGSDDDLEGSEYYMDQPKGE